MIKRLVYYIFEKIKYNNNPLFTLSFYQKFSLFINKKIWIKNLNLKKARSRKYNLLEDKFITDGFCKISVNEKSSTKDYINYLTNNFDLDFNNCIDKSQIEIVSYEQIKNKFLFDFLKSTEIYNLLKSYIGYEPMLFGASVIGSNPTKDNSGSQLFHFDNIEKKSIRLIMLLSDVNLTNGPTTVICKNKSAKIAENVNYFGRRDYSSISDKEFSIQDSDKVYLTGKMGDIFLLDTYACLHSGGRVEKGQRLVFMATLGKGLFTNLRWMYNGKYNLGLKI